MTDFYDYTHAHQLALALREARPTRYFDRLTFAAGLLCEIQDSVAYIALDLARGTPLEAPMSDDCETLTGPDMVREIVIATLRGHIYQGQGDWDYETRNERELRHWTPDAAIVDALTDVAQQAALEHAIAALKRLVSAYGAAAPDRRR